MEPFDLRLWPFFQFACQSSVTFPSFIDQVAIDSNRITSSRALFVALPGSRSDGHHFVRHAAKQGASFALVKHDWNPPSNLPRTLTLLRVDNPLLAFQELAAIYRQQFKGEVVAIIGSHGKTMVKDLIQRMMSPMISVSASPGSYNSQIGVPLSLFQLQRDSKVALIEAAYSQVGETALLAKMIQPTHLVITQLARRYSTSLNDPDRFIKELSLFLPQISPRGWIVHPAHPSLDSYLKGISCSSFKWSTPYPDKLPHAIPLVKECGDRLSYSLQFPDQRVHCFTVEGFSYFLDLINISSKVAWLLGATSESISSLLETYLVEPIRVEIWNSSQEILFINCDYAADPQSIDLSFRYLNQVSPGKKKVFLFHGFRKEAVISSTDYKQMGRSICQAKIDQLLLVGKHPYHPLIEEIQNRSPAIQVTQFDTVEEAIRHLNEICQTGDAVLIKGEKKIPFDQLTELLDEGVCTTRCVIHFPSIAANLAVIRNRLPANHRIMVMVKALAYGTDDVRLAKFLDTCQIDILGVSYVEEAISLRRAGVSQSLFVLHATFYEAKKVVDWGLEVGVSERRSIEAFGEEAARQQKMIPLHLHLDSGMGRFGCQPEDVLELARLIHAHPFLRLEGFMTHFACADDPSQDSFTNKQVALFEKALDLIEKEGIRPKWVHAANSAGVLRFSLSRCNMSRIGLALFGLYPSEATRDKGKEELRLALSLLSRIVGINHCKVGANVSYGRTYTVQREEQKIAILPIGYFDGLHRKYSGQGEVIIRGKKAPMVGTICMDFMMVDVTDIPDASVGDLALIFGEDGYGHYLSPEALASSGGSIIHELMTCLGPRVQRLFVYEEAQRIR